MERDQHRKLLPLIRLLEYTAVPGSSEAARIVGLQKKYFQSFQNVSIARDEAAIAARRDELTKDPELKEIFEVMWEALVNARGVQALAAGSPIHSPMMTHSRPGSSSIRLGSANGTASNPGSRVSSPNHGGRRSPNKSISALSRDGFIKIYMNIVRGLTGEDYEDRARYIAELQYDIDRKVHPCFDEGAFNDWLLELRATWLDLFHPHFQPFFAWSLLDAVIDVSRDDPFLRPWREVQCCVIYSNVHHSFIQRVDVSKRLRGRLMLKQNFQNPLTPNPSMHQSSSPGGTAGGVSFEGGGDGTTWQVLPMDGLQGAVRNNASPTDEVQGGHPAFMDSSRPGSAPDNRGTSAQQRSRAHALQHTLSSVHWRRNKSRWALTHTIKVPFPVSVANVPELPIMIAPPDLYEGHDYEKNYFARPEPISSEDFKKIILQGEFLPSTLPPVSDNNTAVTSENHDDLDILQDSIFNDETDENRSPFFHTEVTVRQPPVVTTDYSLTLSADHSMLSEMYQSSNVLDHVNPEVISEHIQAEVNRNSAMPSAEPSTYAPSDFIASSSVLIDSLNDLLGEHAVGGGGFAIMESLAIDAPHSSLSSPMSLPSFFKDVEAPLHLPDTLKGIDPERSRDSNSLEIKGTTQVLATVRPQNQNRRRSSAKVSQSESASSIDSPPPKLVGFDYNRADKRAGVIKLVHQSSNGELVKRLIPSPERVKRGRLPGTHSNSNLSRSASFGPSSPHRSPSRSPSPKGFEIGETDGSLFSTRNDLSEHEVRSQIIRDVITSGSLIRSSGSVQASDPTAMVDNDLKIELTDRDFDDHPMPRYVQQPKPEDHQDDMSSAQESQCNLRSRLASANEDEMQIDITPREFGHGHKIIISNGQRNSLPVVLSAPNSLISASVHTIESTKTEPIEMEAQQGGDSASWAGSADMSKQSVNPPKLGTSTNKTNEVLTSRSVVLPPISVSKPSSPKPNQMRNSRSSQTFLGSKNPYLRNLGASMRDLGYSHRETIPIVAKCTKAPKTVDTLGLATGGDSPIRTGGDATSAVPLSPKPWIPPGGLETMENDRVDPPQRWEELKNLHTGDPYDLTNTRSVVQRQSLVRNSFESYLNRSGVIKSKFAKVNMLKDHMSFIGQLSNAKVRVEFAESKRNTAFMPMTRKNFN